MPSGATARSSELTIGGRRFIVALVGLVSSSAFQLCPELSHPILEEHERAEEALRMVGPQEAPQVALRHLPVGRP